MNIIIPQKYAFMFIKPNVGKTVALYNMLNLIWCGNMGDNGEET